MRSARLMGRLSAAFPGLACAFLLSGCAGRTTQGHPPEASTWAWPAEPVACRTVARPFSVENPWDHAHEAIDLACPDGTPITVVADGAVTEVEVVELGGEYRYRVHLLLEGEPLRVEYLNLRRADVEVGDRLDAGTPMGTSALGLHLAVWDESLGRYVDPLIYLGGPGLD